MTAVRPSAGSSGVPSAREVVAELRRLRQGHSDTTIWKALETAYLYLFAVLMVGSMGVVAIVQGWRDLSECGTGCGADRLSLSVVFGVALLVIGLRVLVAVGPVVAGRATATFLLAAPVPRGPLLRARAFALLLLGTLLGAGCFGVLAGIAASSLGSVVSAVSAGAVCGLLVTGAAILGQSAGPLRRALTLGGDIALAVVAASIPLLLVRAIDPALLLPTGPWRPVVLVILAVAALGVVVRALRSLSTIQRRDLVAGGDLLSGLSGAAASLDTSLVSDLLHQRRFRRLGARRSRRGRSHGFAAIAYRELLRWLRSPWRIGVGVALLVLPYAAARLGLPATVPAVAVVAGYLAVRPMGAGLHIVERSGGLGRAFPQRAVARRLALAVPLLAGAVVWALLATPALTTATGSLSSSLPMWPALAAAIAAGVIRSVSRPPVAFEGPLISTPAGALPVGFIGQVLCGPDVVALCSLALVFGLRPGPYSVFVLVPVAVLVYLLARGHRTPRR